MKNLDPTYEKVKNEADEFCVVRSIPTKWYQEVVPRVERDDPYEVTPAYMKYFVIETKQEVLQLKGANRGWGSKDMMFLNECWGTEEQVNLAILRLNS